MFPMHGGFFGRGGGSSCPSYIPGKYTAEQVDNLVFVEGYIPISSLSDFRNIPDSSPLTMGAGTCWSGTYTCGVDKKYLQVTPITIDDTVGTTIPALLQGIYDGNWQLITYRQGGTPSIFRLTQSTGDRIVRNILADLDITLAGQGIGLLGIITNTYTIEDCGVYGSVTDTSTGGRVGGLFGTIEAGTSTIVRRCWSKVAVTTNAGADGGASLGGFVRSGTVENCWSSGAVVGANSCAGLVGRNSATGGTITNCYTISPVSGSTAFGLTRINTGTINASYWNTDTGPATSGGGTASNTLALQTPTSPTGIYATWDDTVWDFGTSSEYPTLIGPPPATP